jgi:hypothetical protein
MASLVDIEESRESVGSRTRRRYVAFVRRLVAIFALVGLIASPVSARTRLFCKYTGIEITDCWEGEAPASPLVTAAGCCDHRVDSPLPASKISGESIDVVHPVLGTAVLESLPPPEPFAIASWTVPAASAGPPLFVRHRALLI